MSNIEWTDTTWNPVVGCTPVSPGCLNCYAATMARRLEAMGKKEYAPRSVAEDYRVTGKQSRTIRIAEVKNGRAVFTGEVRCLPERLTEPLHWKRPRRVFVNSMSDLFHEAVPFEFVDRVFAVMALCPQHTFQVLTKRPERMAEYFRSIELDRTRHDWMNDFANSISEPPDNDICINREWPHRNVWLGASAENQDQLDKRVQHLFNCPAAVRFLSLEPLLGEMKLQLVKWCPTYGDEVRSKIGWVIVGGESGPHAREFREEWAESIRDQCAHAGVPFFFKQYGSNATRGEEPLAFKDRKGAKPHEWPEDLRVRQFPEVRR